MTDKECLTALEALRLELKPVLNAGTAWAIKVDEYLESATAELKSNVDGKDPI